MLARRFAVIGDADLDRTQEFLKAAQRAEVTTEVVPYLAALTNGTRELGKLLPSLIRIESPGRNFEVERQFLTRGLNKGIATRYSHYEAENLRGLRRDSGKFFATHQWYLGWVDWLTELRRTALKFGHRFFNDPEEIAVMFDKTACWTHLHASQVPVPDSLSEPSGFDDLVESMRSHGWSRAFLKPRHSSGGSGVVAFAMNRGQASARTALEINTSGAAPTLYTTRRMRAYEDRVVVKNLIDTLCQEPVQVESWIPKAGINGKTFDIRVVVIGGRACHFSLRLSTGPITNLHLGGAKGDEALLDDHSECAPQVRTLAEQTAACFPRSLACGVDIAVAANFRRLYVLEVNAFGDFLKTSLWEGVDTYHSITKAALENSWPP